MAEGEVFDAAVPCYPPSVPANHAVAMPHLVRYTKSYQGAGVHGKYDKSQVINMFRKYSLSSPTIKNLDSGLNALATVL